MKTEPQISQIPQMKKSPALQICAICAAISKLLVFLVSSHAPRKASATPPNTANFPGKSSIPNHPQGACLAQEVGDVGGETCGTARVRAGFAPNTSSSPAQRSFSSEWGFGSGAPESASLLPEAKPVHELTGQLPSEKTSQRNIRLRPCSDNQSVKSDFDELSRVALSPLRASVPSWFAELKKAD